MVAPTAVLLDETSSPSAPANQAVERSQSNFNPRLDLQVAGAVIPSTLVLPA
jgi:hypothetical protein